MAREQVDVDGEVDAGWSSYWPPEQDGETVAGTTADDYSEVETDLWPSQLPKDRFSDNKQAIINHLVVRPEAKKTAVAEKVGVSDTLVHQTLHQARCYATSDELPFDVPDEPTLSHLNAVETELAETGEIPGATASDDDEGNEADGDDLADAARSALDNIHKHRPATLQDPDPSDAVDLADSALYDQVQNLLKSHADRACADELRAIAEKLDTIADRWEVVDDA